MSKGSPDIITNPHELSGMPTDSPILVALSGGADSTALLHLLCDLREKNNFKLYAAHLNHGIRTEKPADSDICEADRDQLFCAALCERLGVKLFISRLDIPTVAKASGQSLETAAREARYAFFADVMRAQGIKILATAHNADDNLETQIFNLARGCGTEGIRGIPPARSLGGVDGGVVIRPLLHASKKSILEYCQNEGLDYVTDSTNLCSDYTRNAIRNEIIPRLESLTGTPQRNALRLSESAREDIDFIMSQATEFLKENDGAILLDEIKELHVALAKRVLILAYAKASQASLEQVHINALLSLLREGREQSKVSLPDKTRARIAGGRLIFEPDLPPPPNQSFDLPLREGISYTPDSSFAVVIGDESCEIFDKNADYYLYASANISVSDVNSLRAKNRGEGDVIRDGNMNKKVKKLLCDKGVALCDRATLPFIHDPDGIIYVPLCAIADRVKTRDTHGITVAIYKKHISED